MSFCHHCHGYPSGDEMAEAIGSRNWVVARPTPRVLAKYTDQDGNPPVCLSQKRYTDAQETAFANRYARRWAASHPRRAS